MKIDRYMHLKARATQDVELDLFDPSDRAIVDVCLGSAEEAAELLALHDELFEPYTDLMEEVYA